MSVIPPQAIPLSKKDKEWKKNTLDGYISKCNFSGAGYNERERIYQCYRAYEGNLNMEDYAHVIKPYGDKTPDSIGNPAIIKNWNIIYPAINIHRGDYELKPKNYTVIATHSDSENRRLTSLKNELKQAARQILINELNAQGIDTSKPSKEVEQIDNIVAKYDRSTYRDEKAINGQIVLDYIVEDKAVHRKLSNGYLDYINSGYVFSIKDAVNNDIEYNIINPLNIDFDRDPNIDFVEDGEYAVISYTCSLSSLIDLFHGSKPEEHLTEEEIKELEQQTSSSFNQSLDSVYYASNNTREGNFELMKVYWKSRVQVGKLYYKDEYGVIQETEVDETYTLNKALGDVRIEWEWINQVWEGSRIANKYYKRIRPILVQRDSIDNRSKCKLPVNGKSFYNRGENSISLTWLGIPYQVTYNIYKYREECTIAKSKDRIAVLYWSHKPTNMSIEEWLAYANSLGFMIIDDTNPNYKPGNSSNSLDLSFSQSISILLDIQRTIKEEWEELSGATRQRRGQTAASTTATAAQQDIQQSYISTAIINSTYEEFEKKEYQGLLDVSKYALIEGKKAELYTPDEGKIILDIDGVEHAETNYGVFVTNSKKEQQKLEMAKQLADRMFQSMVSPTAVLEVIDAGNISKLKQKMKSYEEIAQQMKQAEAENLHKQQLEIEQAKFQAIQYQEENANQRNKDNNDTKLEVATISNYFKVPDTDADNDGTPDAIEIMNHGLEQTKLQIEMKKLAVGVEESNKDRQVEREKMANDLKIAKSKPKPSSK